MSFWPWHKAVLASPATATILNPPRPVVIKSDKSSDKVSATNKKSKDNEQSKTTY